MRRTSNQSLFAWMAVVMVPLAVLAVMAALGIRSQQAAAKSRMRNEANNLCAAQAKIFSRQLEDAVEEFPRFPDPPEPGRWSSNDGVLDGKDIGKLEVLRDDPGAGVSPAGLPRRALAALRIEHLARGRQEPEQLMKLLTVDAPSVLTLPALRRLVERHPGLEIPEGWRLLEQLKEHRVEHPEGGWVEYQNETWWLSPDGTSYLPPSALSTDSLELPDFAEVRLATEEGPISNSQRGELLARSEIRFPSPLALEWVLVSPDAVRDSVSRQTRWTAVLVAVSMLVCVAGLVVILRMIRQERRLNDLKSQFVSSVSHELRAPLGSIRLMADALEDGRVEEPREFHRLISRECQRLSHLLENVLDFARIEEGRRNYHFTETDLDSAVREVSDLFAQQADASGKSIEVVLHPGRASVDRGAIQQAVANLLDNALKFSPPDSTVRVELDWSDASWSLCVVDEGPGIPESEFEQVFERFYRLGDELRRETKGTGLGLSLVKHIAEAHGGTVSITNHPTTFTMSAPTRVPATS